ncbi:MAG: 23S rRNA (guanosine(2251)-2'-O)-methyltransferase RlmB [Cellvibrionaceae bacterium]|nr:23S rRNA (guanosine(2251)-2'-O)-methyltransferase RlmB [Cellvibrionaceae bacterium]
MSEFIFGLHSVQTLLERSPAKVQQLYLLQGRQDRRLQRLRALAQQHNIDVQMLAREQLDQHVGTKHQGVLAQLKQPNQVYDEAFLKNRLQALLTENITPLLLVLDGVTDPHNLGACLRTAEAAGVQFVIIPKDNAASLTNVAIKVACGAAEVLPLVRVTNLSRTLKWLQEQGLWLVGTAGSAKQNYCDIDLKGPLAIVMGAEGKGLRRLTQENCDYLVRIPMTGHVSSLNVSVATGVCLFEALRQRQSL